MVPADVPNDSSCEITVIETILDWAHDILRSSQVLHAHKLGLGGLVLAQYWTCGVVGVRKNHTFLFSLAARGVSRFQVFGGRARLFHSTASSFPFLNSVFLRPVRDTLQTDNCAREGKNSIVAKWSCQAVAKGKRLRYAVAMIYF